MTTDDLRQKRLVGTGGEDCPFCDLTGFRAAPVFLENSLCAFAASWEAPESQILPGSGILIPKAHRESPFELTPAEWTATHELLGMARTVIAEVARPDGWNLAWNVGPVAGQEAAHVHLHLIPRFADEPYAGRGVRWWLKREGNRRPEPFRPGSSPGR